MTIILIIIVVILIILNVGAYMHIFSIYRIMDNDRKLISDLQDINFQLFESQRKYIKESIDLVKDGR